MANSKIHIPNSLEGETSFVRVLLPSGIASVTLQIQNGLIKSIEQKPTSLNHGPILIPGLVDCHVHVNEPGRTEWEGFETATLAASAGAITTLIDMPLNCSPVTTTLSALETKLNAIQGKLSIDVGFWGGVIPGNADELIPMAKKGVRGFKCFLIHSGLEEFPHVTVNDLEEHLPILAKLNLPLLVHAELESTHTHVAPSENYTDYLHSRPREWENEAIKLVIKLCEKYRAPMHIVHLSSSDALSAIAHAKQRGLPLTVETCPHYLFFPSEEIKAGDTRFKCAPPIREKQNQTLLWQGLKDGVIDFVVSDHSPCTPELKKMGDFHNAWGGISSVQLGLQALLSRAPEYQVTLPTLINWMSKKPAQFLGLTDRGSIEVGKRADFALFDPDRSLLLTQDQILHRHKLTPYEGKMLKGQTLATYLRGQKIFQHGQQEKPPLLRIGKTELSPHKNKDQSQ